MLSPVALRNTCFNTSTEHSGEVQKDGLVIATPSSNARLKQANKLLYPVHRLPRYSTWNLWSSFNSDQNLHTVINTNGLQSNHNKST